MASSGAAKPAADAGRGDVAAVFAEERTSTPPCLVSCTDAPVTPLAPAWNWFCSPVKAMAFGFGGDASPRADTLAVLDAMTQSYIGTLMSNAVAQADKSTRPPRLDDLLFVLRKDRPKCASDRQGEVPRASLY